MTICSCRYVKTTFVALAFLLQNETAAAEKGQNMRIERGEKQEFFDSLDASNDTCLGIQDENSSDYIFFSSPDFPFMNYTTGTLRLHFSCSFKSVIGGHKKWQLYWDTDKAAVTIHLPHLFMNTHILPELDVIENVTNSGRLTQMVREHFMGGKSRRLQF